MHKRSRRADGIPLLEAKFRKNPTRRFPQKQQDAILAVSLDQRALEAMPVNEYVDLYRKACTVRDRAVDDAGLDGDSAFT